MAGRSSLRLVCACASVLYVAGSSLHAQLGSGALTGQVVDQAGASAPGALLTVTEVGTTLTRTTVTATDGGYSIPSLPPGTYRIRAELSGFRTVIREGVRLATGETVRLDLQLELGSVAEAVTVEADAPLLRSATSGLGHVIDNRKIVDLPLNGRSFISARRPGARRGRAAAARGAAAAHQRRTAAHQRVPVRRHLGVAARARPGRVLPQRRRHPGVQDREQQPAGRVRPLQRRRRQPDDQVGEQRVSRNAVRVLPSRGAERAQLLRVGQCGQAAVSPQPVRRRAGRADSPRSDVLLRRLSGTATDHRPHGDLHRAHACSSGRASSRRRSAAACRRSTIRRRRCRSARRRDADAVPGQRHPRRSAWIRSRATLLERYPLPTSAGTANNYRRTENETVDQDQFSAPHRPSVHESRPGVWPAHTIPGGVPPGDAPAGRQRRDDRARWGRRTRRRGRSPPAISARFSSTLLNELRIGDTRRAVGRTAARAQHVGVVGAEPARHSRRPRRFPTRCRRFSSAAISSSDRRRTPRRTSAPA